MNFIFLLSNISATNIYQRFTSQIAKFTQEWIAEDYTPGETIVKDYQEDFQFPLNNEKISLKKFGILDFSFKPKAKFLKEAFGSAKLSVIRRMRHLIYSPLSGYDIHFTTIDTYDLYRSEIIKSDDGPLVIDDVLHEEINGKNRIIKQIRNNKRTISDNEIQIGTAALVKTVHYGKATYREKYYELYFDNKNILIEMEC